MQRNCGAKVRPAELVLDVFGEMKLGCIFVVLFAQATGGYRGVEQLVARRAHNPKVVSSSLAPATKHLRCTKQKSRSDAAFFVACSQNLYGQTSPNKVKNTSKSADPMVALPSKSYGPAHSLLNADRNKRKSPTLTTASELKSPGQ